MTGPAAPGPRRPRIAYLAFWTTEYDSRLERMARSSLAAGYDVTVYGRLLPGQLPVEERAGYRIVRVPARASFAALVGRAPASWPGRGRTRTGPPGEGAGDAPADAPADGPGDAQGEDLEGPGPRPMPASGRRPMPDTDPDGVARTTPTLFPAGGPPRPPAGVRGRVRAAVDGTGLEPAYRGLRRRWHALRRWLLHPRERIADRRLPPRRWTWFLETVAGWAVALDDVAEPADVWHGFSIGGLPAAVRQRRRLGGRAVYDSRDVFVQARSMVTAAPPRRWVHARFERRWAARCDAVVTVNEGCADLLVRQLRLRERPLVVMNCPEATSAPVASDLIRERLGLPAATRVVLYQGVLLTERGIEQGMDAILRVPDAVFAVLGYGELREVVAARAAASPYAGRVHLLPAVPPGELLGWTAAADVMLIAIQPTTPNHRLATPNKLFEAMAAGVPIVAADLPGMAAIVGRVGCGVLVDPTDPEAIARGIRALLDLPEAERRAVGALGAAAARSTYSWGAQEGRLLALHARLAGRPAAPGAS